MDIILKRKIAVSISAILLAAAMVISAAIKTDAHVEIKTLPRTDSTAVSSGRLEGRANEASAKVSRPVQEDPKPMFIMKLVGNELRIVSADDESHYTVIDTTDARTLRDIDRLRLIDGIEIYNQEELAAIIEDFSS